MMKQQIEELIKKYIEETLDNSDEFSHGDASARMYAYGTVAKDLQEVIRKQEEKEKVQPKLYVNKQTKSSVSRLLCPSCESGFLRMEDDESVIPEPLYHSPNAVFRSVNNVPYCECCKQKYTVQISQKDLRITITPL